MAGESNMLRPPDAPRVIGWRLTPGKALAATLLFAAGLATATQAYKSYLFQTLTGYQRNGRSKLTDEMSGLSNQELIARIPKANANLSRLSDEELNAAISAHFILQERSAATDPVTRAFVATQPDAPGKPFWTLEDQPSMEFASQRMQNFYRTHAIAGRSWDETSANFQRSFGFAPKDRSAYDEWAERAPREILLEHVRTQASADLPTTSRIGQAIPFWEVAQAVQYEGAKNRFEKGTPTGQDYGTIAHFEYQQQLRVADEQGVIGKLRSFSLGFPSCLALAMLGLRLVSVRVPQPECVDPLQSWAKHAWEFIMLIPRQHKIIWAGIACLGCLALYVPWNYTYGGHDVRPAGYALIFYPSSLGSQSVRVDLVRLLIPMAFVICVTIAGVILTSQKTRKAD